MTLAAGLARARGRPVRSDGIPARRLHAALSGACGGGAGSRPAVGARGPHLHVGPWGARFLGRRFPCAVGRGGIGEKTREGDGVTPRGVHRIEAVRHRGPRAPGILPARRIGPGDGWADDPADPAYNRPVRRPHPFSHEALHRPDRLYDLVAALDWNRTPVVPGRGSAIFLHAWRKPRHPTAGCIAFALADLAWILARWTPQSRVIVG